MEDLYRLAQQLQQRSIAEFRIAQQIGAPFSPARVVKYLMCHLLQIAQDSGSAYDGRFTEGSLAGMTVKIHYYSSKLRLMAGRRNVVSKQPPDYHLLVVGARAEKKRDLLSSIPTIESIYLLSASEIDGLLSLREAKCDIEELLEQFQIHPESRNRLLCLTDEQRDVLERFSLAELESELRWQQLFEQSQDKLAEMAEAAHQAHLCSETKPLI